MSEITEKRANMWNLMKFKKGYLLLSGLLLLPGVFSLFVFGLRLSTDFTGGSVTTYSVSPEHNIVDFKEPITGVYEEAGVSITSSRLDENEIELRTTPIESAQNDVLKEKALALNDSMSQNVFETIGPSVGKETTKKAFIALGVATGAILLYIAYAFKNVPKPYSSFRFGASAIVAMLHDALLLLGVFSILGKFAHIEVDILFITAVLTVIGFSIHDSIVVFDRIRENLRKLPTSWTFAQVVNFSVIETLNRSFATSLTVMITLLSLFILGGSSVKHFVLALLIGILSGTYSSVFTASPILVLWEEQILKRKKKK